MQRIVPEPVKGFMIGREQANYVLNEAFFGVRCSASCTKKAEVQSLIWRS
jgi:hypothetical protein